MISWLTGTVVGIVWLQSLYLRLVPAAAMRAWFAVTLAITVIALAAGTFVCDCFRYVGVPHSRTGDGCAVWSKMLFRLLAFFNPQISITFDEKEQIWSDIPKRTAIVSNHTSFWDSFGFIGFAPLRWVHCGRTLYKASLRNVPVYGGVFDRIGNFPVYFKSEADGFGVDKERQAQVAKDIQAHIDRDGNFGFFPEGSVNKTPRVLQPLRHGSFQIVIKNRLPLYMVIMCGNDETWPPGAYVGGYPADVLCSVRRLRAQVDYGTVTAPELAEIVRGEMQEELDRLYSIRDAWKKSA